MDPLFIDSGGIDILVDPKVKSLIRFWQRFPEDCRHSTSHVVYWKFMRQFGAQSNSLARQRFVKLVAKNGINFFLRFWREGA